MAEIRTLVAFESAAFNTSEHRDCFLNQGCYGDDVARWLVAELRARGIQTDAEPGQEDFGWYCGFHVGEIDYQFVIGYRPGGGGDPGIWIGWVERKAGLVGSVLGARKRGIQADALRAIHAVLSSASQVNGVRWHHREEFQAGNEGNAQAEPMAT